MPNSQLRPRVVAQEHFEPPPAAGARPRPVPAAAGMLDLRTLWRVGRRHAKPALIAAVVVPLVVLTAMLMAPLRYTGTAVLLLDPRGTKVVTSEEVLPGFGSDAAAIESQAQLMMSDGFVRQVIERQHLAQDPEIAEQPSLLRRLFGGSAPATKADDPVSSETVLRFKDKLSVARKGLTYIVEVTFKGAKPESAARFANAVADTYLRQLSEQRLSATEQASSFLSDRLQALREKAQKSDAAVAEFRAAHKLVDAGQSTSLVERQLTDLNQQLTLAQSRLADAEARLKDIRAARSDPSGSFPEALQSPLITALRTQYSTLSQRVTEYARSLGDRHPTLLAARSQLNELREQIGREIGRIEAGVRRDYTAARSREGLLQARLDQVKRQSGSDDQQSVELHELQRQSDADRAIYNQFLTRFKDTRQQEGLRVSDARLVSAATPPDRSNLPKSWILAAIAVMAGLFAAFAAILVADNLDTGIRSAETIEREVGIPCIGILPDVKAAERRGTPADDDGLRQFLRMFRGPRGAAPIEVLLVSAVDPGAGTSLVASAIAAAAASAGFETLLIETGPSRSRLPSGMPDLYELLADGRDLADGLQPSGAGHMLLAAAERRPARADDLLSSGAMGRLLARCRRSFQVVVIDGPLTGSAHSGADVAQFVDCVTFVVEWGKTRVKGLAAAVQTLPEESATQVTAVLNKVDLARYPFYETAT